MKSSLSFISFARKECYVMFADNGLSDIGQGNVPEPLISSYFIWE